MLSSDRVTAQSELTCCVVAGKQGSKLQKILIDEGIFHIRLLLRTRKWKKIVDTKTDCHTHIVFEMQYDLHLVILN